MWRNIASRESIAKGVVGALRSCCGQVRWSTLRKQSGVVGTEIFVSRLSYYTTEEDFKATFSRFGDVEEARLIRDKLTQRPRGFGFVRYKSEVDAEHAVKAMDGRVITCTGNSCIMKGPHYQSCTKYPLISINVLQGPFREILLYLKTWCRSTTKSASEEE